MLAGQKEALREIGDGVVVKVKVNVNGRKKGSLTGKMGEFSFPI
jgi:hypothetical protein